ncbi:CaiB/BaiF CoA transferase family protein [Burkholderia multivorans]|uniref:CaiB/BaiF CoA transferase family protein n=1 Tax=Burkholderia multivorans TaxID=87883 RepID=UPI001C220829|nr:CoA transferase [Burkholderia multivorans]MBU9253809.1 CoA transferase [Burkholderia multivorans]
MSNEETLSFQQPIKGLKVLELSQIMAGPVCGLMLADMGADVYKVEKIPNGDDARSYGKASDAGIPPSFVMLNRGKRSIGIDIKSDVGKAVLLRMAAQSDVITENFRPGVIDRLGLGYEALRQLNPALIYCSITGYGRKGPLASKGGFDLILQAFSGLISVTGEEDGAPVKPGVSIADVNAGILAAVGILAAYVHRLRTGRGQRVDTSLLQASLQQMYWYAAAYFSRGVIAKPSGTAHPLISPYQVYRCRDGRIAIGGANEANWERIAETLGHPEWKADPRFATPDARLAHRRALETLINDVLSSDNVESWLRRLDEASVPAGPVQNVAQALEHEQSKAIGMVVDVEAPNGGTTRSLGLPIHFNGTTQIASRAAPRVGQDTTDILRRFGFSDGEIDDLIASGAVLQAGVSLDTAVATQG